MNFFRKYTAALLRYNAEKMAIIPSMLHNDSARMLCTTLKNKQLGQSTFNRYHLIYYGIRISEKKIEQLIGVMRSAYNEADPKLPAKSQVLFVTRGPKFRELLVVAKKKNVFHCKCHR